MPPLTAAAMFGAACHASCRCRVDIDWQEQWRLTSAAGSVMLPCAVVLDDDFDEGRPLTFREERWRRDACGGLACASSRARGEGRAIVSWQS